MPFPRSKKHDEKRRSSALKRYVRGSAPVKLPTKWTPAHVRVDQKGDVKIKVNPTALGSGGRFAKCVKSVEARGGAYDPRAVCASAGIKKYGKRKMEAMARAGRKRAKKANPKKRRNSLYEVKVPASSHDPGYALKISAESASGAKVAARKYCAKGKAGYKLPSRTSVRKLK